MPERWERELQKLRGVEVREPMVRQRVERGPSGHRPPSRRDRLAAGIVAAVVFLAAGAFAWRALGPGGDVPFAAGSWPVATVSFTTSAAGEPLATLDVGGSEQEGLTGAATSPNDHYPYSWLPPDRLDDLAQPLEVPMGSELALDGDVAIKELLYGGAEQLDAGAGPDSGPIWADQPDFSEPYFLPWDEEPERTYLKFFGTWADGDVLDVYFEVVFVAPDVDLTDPGAEIVVTPEPMGAAFLYGGQRAPMGVLGGTYGNTSMTAEPAGFDEDAIVAKVPAGTTLEIGGEDLVDASLRAGGFPFGEGGTPLDGAVPTEAGRYVLTMEVTWGGGSATFLHQIEVVPAPEGEPLTETPSPPPSSAGSVAIDIRRSSEETGDPVAHASLGGQDVRMCPDGWSLVNEDGTREELLFDCGQEATFTAPADTPIVVSGDFASVDATARLSEPGDRTSYEANDVPAIEPGSVVFYQYAVEWDDGSTASFWLLLTVGSSGSPGSVDPARILVKVFGVGERSNESPIATFSYGGETKTACIQDFEWTREDGTSFGMDVASGAACDGRAIEVPPGTSIAIEAESTTSVSTTRATTQFFEGDVGLVVTAEWPDGHATFVVPLTVAAGTPDLELVVLDCRPSDQVEFTGPVGQDEPAGSSYIVGNLPGFEADDVVEQMTREAGTDPLAGVWQVVREGSVVASVDYPELRGAACEGTGIGGT
jgi:hypothetical protein